ncbi:MAG: hypothetical protein AABX83_03460 [Nanoarchaeota archaeon]
MIYEGTSEDLEKLLEGKREEIAQAAKKAREGIREISAFCYNSNETKLWPPLGFPEDSALKNSILGKDYLHGLLKAYVRADNIEDRMKEFAKRHGKDYSEVKKILDFLGLEV